MKKFSSLLLILLVLSSLAVAVRGAYLKYGVLRKLDLCQDEPIMAVPFIYMADEALQYSVEALKNPAPPTLPTPSEIPSVPATQMPTLPPTEAPTEPWPDIVEDSWFDDVLFIGDSRTTGLQQFARLGKAEYFCDVGMTVFSILKKQCEDTNFPKMPLEELLSTHKYGKVYINLGLNECGYSHDTVIQKYGELISLVQEKQPDAVVVLQGIMTVGKKKSESKSYFGLDNLRALNDRIAAQADGDKIRYVDVNEWLADENGFMPDDWSGDGCHPYPAGYQEWAQWLKTSAAALHIR